MSSRIRVVAKYRMDGFLMVSWKDVVRYQVCMVCLLLNQICFEVWRTARGMPHLDKIALARGPSWKFCAESTILSVCQTKHWQKSKHNSRQEKAPQNRQRHHLQSSSQGIKQEAASDRKPTEQKTESINAIMSLQDTLLEGKSIPNRVPVHLASNLHRRPRQAFTTGGCRISSAEKHSQA